MIPSQAWSPEDIATLQSMWNEGASAGMIAPHVGKSRNACVGMIHRLRSKGMEFKDHPQPPALKPRLRRQPGSVVLQPFRPLPDTEQPHAAKVARSATPAAPVKPANPHAIAVTLQNVDNDRCKFPVGPGNGPDLLMCGAPSLSGTSWCEWHGVGNHPARVWQPRQPRAECE